MTTKTKPHRAVFAPPPGMSSRGKSDGCPAELDDNRASHNCGGNPAGLLTNKAAMSCKGVECRVEVAVHTFLWEAWEDGMQPVQPVGHTALVSWTRADVEGRAENSPPVVVSPPFQMVETPKVYIHLRPQLIKG